MTVVKPAPPGGPLNAADIGYSYHLVIQGYDNGDEPDIVVFVKKFLRLVFNTNTNCPLRYGFHSVVQTPGSGSRKTLRLSFALNMESPQSLRLDDALRIFARQLFSLNHDICDKACRTLSEYGIYGFAPQEETMKIHWYESLFTWMKGFGKESMTALDQQLEAVSRHNGVTSWLPSWTGAALFALSLGLATMLLGPTAKTPDALKTVDVKSIHALLMRICLKREQETTCTTKLEELLKQKSEAFLRQSESVIDGLAEQPTNERPLAMIASNMTIQLVNLFEIGFDTVTSCRQAVEIFVDVKKDNVVKTGIGVADLCFSAYNLFKIGAVAKDVSVSLPLSLELFTGIRLLGRVIGSAYNAKTVHDKQVRWAKVITFVAAGVRHGQYCELYLRWVSNSSLGDGPQQGSQRYRELLSSLIKQMDMKLPTPEECTDIAIRARLQAYSSTLRRQKEELALLL